MTFSPRQDADIRITFAPERRGYVVEQAFIRRRNGATQREDLAAIENLDQESWRIIAYPEGIEDAIGVATRFMLEDNVNIRSIDLGPAHTTDPAVVATVGKLLALIL